MPTYTKYTLSSQFVNASLQEGDLLIAHSIMASPPPSGIDNWPVISFASNTDYIILGNVVSIDRATNSVTCDRDIDVEILSPANGWTMGDTSVLNNCTIIAHKNKIVNESGVKGYYAEIDIISSSCEKSELFAVSSDVNISSK